MLAAKHQRGRKLPDLLIAAAAEANGLTVLHYDADFDRISAVTGQRLRVGSSIRLGRLTEPTFRRFVTRC